MSTMPSVLEDPPVTTDPAPTDAALVRWVVHAFDRALDRVAHGATLAPLHDRVAADAERLSAAASGRRRARMQRLLQLAPAAIDWLDQHAGEGRLAACPAFRGHLLRRCEAILAEPLEPAADD